MYVCLCNAVSDTAIRKAVRNYQPKTFQELKSVVPVANKCGKCACKARLVMEDELQQLVPFEKIA
ncbi:bacterioferritin-associated ferredoxin [Sodalis sp. C49]|uniref:bacterioferritin-associated ferredoxin n=1 Tax=unclassified Sodalis (in: enterobacteria) TaxID=2636512 RepID=UPI003965C039